MAKQRTTFAKLQRERAKAAKKAEKQAARINGGTAVSYTHLTLPTILLV